MLGKKVDDAVDLVGHFLDNRIFRVYIHSESDTVKKFIFKALNFSPPAGIVVGVFGEEVDDA